MQLFSMFLVGRSYPIEVALLTQPQDTSSLLSRQTSVPSQPASSSTLCMLSIDRRRAILTDSTRSPQRLHVCSPSYR